MKIECERRYGQPKLTKPMQCTKQNFTGWVRFGRKPVSCKVWASGGTVYTLHRDRFSKVISFEEAKKRGLVVTKQKKFVYDDNFGSVILRNEAIISFDTPNMARFMLDNRHALVVEFANMLGISWQVLPFLHRWEDFF